MDLDAYIDCCGSAEVLNYAMCMLKLQLHGLTFKEARAVLHFSWETMEDITSEYNITYEAVYNLIRRGNNKINRTGKTLDEICGEHMIKTMYISPNF